MRRPHTATTIGLGVAIAAALAFAASGCTRHAHRRADFGVPAHTFFDRQAAATSSGPPRGLDSEEAAVIHERYRASLGASGDRTPDAAGASVLVLEKSGEAATR